MSTSRKMHAWTPELGSALDQLRRPSRARELSPRAGERGLLRVAAVAGALGSASLAVAAGAGHASLGAAVGAVAGVLTGFGAHRIVGYLQRRRDERAHDATPIYRTRG